MFLLQVFWPMPSFLLAKNRATCIWITQRAGPQTFKKAPSTRLPLWCMNWAMCLVWSTPKARMTWWLRSTNHSENRRWTLGVGRHMPFNISTENANVLVNEDNIPIALSIHNILHNDMINGTIYTRTKYLISSKMTHHWMKHTVYVWKLLKLESPWSIFSFRWHFIREHV